MKSASKFVSAYLLTLLAGTVIVGAGSGPVSAAANQAPTASITSPSAGKLYFPATVTVSASAQDSDGTVAKVEFLVGTTVIATDTSSPYQATWTPAAVGTYSLTARATDNLGKTGTSSAVSVQVVTPPATITSPANNAIIQGRSVNVSGSTSAPDTSSIILTAGGGHSAVASVAGGLFNATISLAPGSNLIEIQIARRDGTSDVVTTTVTSVDPPVVAITAPQSCMVYSVGQNAAFSADAASLSGSITKVEFFDNDVKFGESTTAPYSASKVLSESGLRAITAKATDSFGFSTISAAAVANVQSQPPVIAITAPANGSQFRTGSSINLTASASDPDGTVSRVDYYANGSLVGGATSSPYAAAWTGFSAGTYSLTAKATDNTGVVGTSPAITVTVANNALPSVSLTSPANGATFTSPASIPMAATASDSDGTIARVEFLSGTAVIGQSTSPPYQATWSGVAPGTYTLSARAFDNDGASSQSGSRTITVNAPPANQPPTITITSPSAGALVTVPGTVILAATASDADGSVAKVEFFDGATLLATISNAPFTFAYVDPPLGTRSIVATATDNLGATRSASVSISVTGTSLSLSSPADASQFSAPASYQIAGQVSTSSGTINTVDFLDNGVVIGSLTLNVPSGSVSWSYSGVGAGSHVHVLRAQHSNGSSYLSKPVTVEVFTAPGVEVSRPFAGEHFVAPATVFLRGSLVNVASPVSRVEFRANGVLVASATTAPYEAAWPNVSAGNYQIQATIVMASGQSYSSAPASITVGNASVTVDPSVGTTVADDRVRLFGTSNLPWNSAILVEGMLAVRDLAGNWAVDNVPLSSGANSMVVQGVTLDGPIVEATASIQSTGQKPFVFAVSASEAIAPFDLDVSLNYRGSDPLSFSRAEFYFSTGASVPDYVATTMGDGGIRLTASVSNPGWGTGTVKVFNASGALVFEQSIRFLSHDPLILGALLKDEFAETIARLGLNDVAGAVRRFSDQAKYQGVFNFLGSRVPTAASAIGTVENILFSEDAATLRLVRIINGTANYFPVRLNRGADGLWRIGGM